MKFRKRKDGSGVEIVGEVEIVPIDRLQPNKWNPNKMTGPQLETFRRILRQHGFLDPVLVRSGDDRGTFEDGRLEIINGEQRWTATKMEGGDRIRIINMGRVSDAKAKALTLIENDLRGTHDREAVAEIIAELDRLDPEGALISTLPYTPDELDGFRSLGESSFDVLDELPDDRGKQEDDDDDEEGDDEDDDADVGEVVKFLGLHELSDKMEERLLGRLEALAGVVEHKRRPGGLLKALIDIVLDHLGLEAEEVGEDDKPAGKPEAKRRLVAAGDDN